MEALARQRASRRHLRLDARIARYVLGVAAFAGAYYVAAQGGYALQFTGSISAIWPPVGLAAAVLYLGGLRWWPGAVIGDLLSNNGASPLGTTIAVTAANLGEITVMTLLLRRLIGRRAQLDSLAQVGGTLAAIAPAVAITATVATVALLADGTIHSHEVPAIWRTIWLGDAAGALVVLPLILAWAHFPSAAWRARHPIEAAAMIVAVVGLSVLALSSNSPFAYLVFPALIWAALRFGQQGATLAVAVAAGMAVWETANNVGPFVQHSITQSALTTQLYIAVAALTTLCLAAIVSERQKSASELVEAKRREVERAAEERQRIARDLHDSVSQSLFSMALHARTAERALEETGQDPSGPVGRELSEVGELSRTALAEMRALIFELRPDGLAEEGLVAALTKHAGAITAREDLPIDVTGPAERLPIDADAEEQLYRLGQEALANVVKHADATRASVDVGIDGTRVTIEIRDNGCGFDPDARFAGHFGLESMRSRAEDLGGRVEIVSSNGAADGSVVRIEVPARGIEI